MEINDFKFLPPARLRKKMEQMSAIERIEFLSKGDVLAAPMLDFKTGEQFNYPKIAGCTIHHKDGQRFETAPDAIAFGNQIKEFFKEYLTTKKD